MLPGSVGDRNTPTAQQRDQTAAEFLREKTKQTNMLEDNSPNNQSDSGLPRPSQK